ncbi:hypothetical protein DMB66_37100, partial [Actinoplanes sp. ATCC 53533]
MATAVTVAALAAFLGLGRVDAAFTATTSTASTFGAAPGFRSGDLYSWGGTPTRVGTASGWIRPTAGNGYACAMRTDGSLWCWGANGDGQLGLGDTVARNAGPVQLTGAGWTAVAAGSRHTCAVRSDGTLWCWGANSAGQLGLGDLAVRDVPVPVGAATTWASVAAGVAHTCATRVDGSLWCWGANDAGQLGLGDTTDRAAP